MTDRDREDVVVECTLDAPPEKVWRALTEPDLVAAWLLPGDAGPEAGHRFTLDGRGADLPRGIDCTVLEAKPHRLLRWSWRADGVDSVVSFELERLPAGRTHLRVAHGGFRAPVAANGNAAPTMLMAA